MIIDKKKCNETLKIVMIIIKPLKMNQISVLNDPSGIDILLKK